MQKENRFSVEKSWTNFRDLEKQERVFWKIKRIGKDNDIDIVDSFLKKYNLCFKKVLDLGAGEKRMKKVALKNALTYFTMDIDETREYDYRDINEIYEKFPIILFLQTLEHLDYKEGLKYLKKITEICENYVFISIPNIYAPAWIFWNDITHLKNWSPRGVCTLLEEKGFETKIYRVGYSKFAFLKDIISRLIGIDWCMSIFIIAKKDNIECEYNECKITSTEEIVRVDNSSYNSLNER